MGSSSDDRDKDSASRFNAEIETVQSRLSELRRRQRENVERLRAARERSAADAADRKRRTND